MIISESIGTWAKKHSMEDTMEIMKGGEVIQFVQEEVCSTDAIAHTALTVAYMYFDIERERRRDRCLMKVASRDFKIGNYFGFEPGSFKPNEKSKHVVEMYQEASRGVAVNRIACRLNDIGLTTVTGKPFTYNSVRRILSNPVYCGDVTIEGVRIEGHHEGIVERKLWERVNPDKRG